MKSTINNSLGLIYELRREYELAIPYFKKAYDFDKENNNLFSLSVVAFNLGNAYIEIDNTQKGFEYLNQALKISKEINDTVGIAYAKKNLASIHIQKQNYEMANSYLVEALELFKIEGNKNIILDIYTRFVNLYIAQNNLAKAKEYQKLSIDFANDNVDRKHIYQYELDRNEIEILKLEGNKNLAIDKLEELFKKELKRQREQNLENIEQVAHQAELKTKEEQNRALVAENNAQKIVLDQQESKQSRLINYIAISSIIILLLAYLFQKNVRQKKDLYKLANFDFLTNLPNRRNIMKSLNKTLKNLNHNQSFFISILDLDNFKNFNDLYGHIGGDELLSEFGKLCSEVIQSPNECGRLGGEEFLIIIKDKYLYNANELLEKLLNKAKELKVESVSNHPIISFSAGLVECKQNHKIKGRLIAADSAMYKAKKMGKSRIITSSD